MSKIYLDNNVFVDIESGIYNLSDFLSLEDVEYYFSSAHIEELIEGQNIQSLSIDDRLLLIEKICGKNFILQDVTTPTINPMSPKDVFNLYKKPLIRSCRNQLNEAVSDFNVDRNKFLEILGIRKIDINNIPPQNIIKELDKALYSIENYSEQINIKTYVNNTHAIGRSVFHTLFNLLDFACYHKDKQTEHSNVARMYDASHIYYAQLCDYFVSQDKRLKYKAEAVYSYLGIETRVISTTDYIRDFLKKNE